MCREQIRAYTSQILLVSMVEERVRDRTIILMSTLSVLLCGQGHASNQSRFNDGGKGDQLAITKT